MTSTNFSVGLLDGRNSSRVLKPPGGGHSRIFGDGDESAPKPQLRAQNSSELKECLVEKTETPKVADEPDADIKNDENKEQENNKQQGPQRTRVPPGGFSSGFW